MVENIARDDDSIELEILDIQQIEEKPEPYNSYNPKFSHDETYVAFEISHEMYNKIYIYQMAVTESGSGFSFMKIHEVYMEESIGEDLTVISRRASTMSSPGFPAGAHLSLPLMQVWGSTTCSWER